MRHFLTRGLLVFPLWAGALAAQGRTPFAGEILGIEDRRAPREADLAALRRRLASSDPQLIARSLRALGRLERPGVIVWVTPLLAHPDPQVRLAAAEGLAQAAQGFRRDSTVPGRGSVWDSTVAALTGRILPEEHPVVLGSLALTLGRLPYVTPEEIRTAREQLLLLAARVAADPDPVRETARGMETLVRASWRRVPLDGATVTHLVSLVSGSADEPTRRHALGALLAAQAADPGPVSLMLSSTDQQSRRLAVTGLPRFPAGSERDRRRDSALTDASAMVRLEALRATARMDTSAAGCARLLAAVSDAALEVSLVAIDLLDRCRDSAATALVPLLAPGRGESWHRAGHALVSLARAAPALARAGLAPASAAPVWQTRMYAARAAAVLRDTPALRRLAADPEPNVREAAVAGLAAGAGHAADDIYRAALASRDYQLVLTAARALAGTPDPDAAEPALLRALARISRERRETSRDARLALLATLRGLGRPRTATPLRSYRTDFDPVVADSAAAALSAVTGRPHRAAPRPLPVAAVTAAEAEAVRGRVFRVRMASGGFFDVALLADEAPLTVARLARLVRRGWFNGRSFHRVAPNFVLQGGSPGANEYAGDGPFMRDEIGARSHERGTLGVSTRGRDTGDGQIFINLVDNPRLDWEYTVWGRVIAGLDVVDAIHEGDVIRRVEIRP